MINYYKTFSTVILTLAAVISAPVFAADNNQKTAAIPVVPVNTLVIKQEITPGIYDRREILKTYLSKKNSPLTGYVDSFLKVADEYNLDYRLLPAISGVESGFGSALIPAFHNPFGWGGGKIPFSSFPEAFSGVAKGLRSRYVPSGEITPFNIGPTYAANPNWANRVTAFMQEIEPTP